MLIYSILLDCLKWHLLLNVYNIFIVDLDFINAIDTTGDSVLQDINPQKISAILEKENNLNSFIILSRATEISTIKRNFEDGIAGILEDAKRRKSGSLIENLPWWGWALLLFFGFDDVLRWIYSLWIVPILMFVGAYYALDTMNMTHIPKGIYYDLENSFNRLVKKVWK